MFLVTVSKGKKNPGNLLHVGSEVSFISANLKFSSGTLVLIRAYGVKHYVGFWSRVQRSITYLLDLCIYL